MNVFGEIERIGDGAIVTCFSALCGNLPGETKENHGILQLEYSLLQPRYEAATQ
jgi:hypothetical protein